MIVAYGTTVIALGLSLSIATLFDAPFLAGAAFLLVVAAGFLVLSRLSSSTEDAEPTATTHAAPAAPPMHNLIKVPVFAAVLLGLWIGTWALEPRSGVGLSLFLVFAGTMAKVVSGSLPLGYGVLVVLLFWCSALVLLMWPGGGYPSEVPWPIMAGLPVLHLLVQVAVYAGGTAQHDESKDEARDSASPGARDTGSSSGRGDAAD